MKKMTWLKIIAAIIFSLLAIAMSIALVNHDWVTVATDAVGIAAWTFIFSTLFLYMKYK